MHGFYSLVDTAAIRVSEIASSNIGSEVFDADTAVFQLFGAPRPLSGDVEVLVVFVDHTDEGVELRTLAGLSSAGTWTAGGPIDSGGAATHRVCAAGADILLLRRVGGTDLKSSLWTGDPGAFDESDIEVTGEALIVTGAGAGSFGLACTYAKEEVGLGYDTWYSIVPAGAGQTLTGNGIPSEEAFGRTTGVTGGGLTPCDPVVVDNPAAPDCAGGALNPDPITPIHACGHALAV
jgi:hypothetical protein